MRGLTGRAAVAIAAAVSVIGIAGCSSSALTTGSDVVSCDAQCQSAAAVPSFTPVPTIAPVATTPTPTKTVTPPPKRATKPASGGIVVNGAGAILPNHSRTPGAINPAVTQSNIYSTICVSGWTATIRPSSSYTTGIKEQQLASGYSYHGDTNTSDYEEDHLISLELGGSPTSVKNLWPEPYQTTDGARTKDKIENKLHSLVCAGQLSLATAQHAIAANWWVAYTTYIGTTVSTPVSHPKTTHRTDPPVTNPGNGATALCNDGTYSYAAHHQGACSHHGGVKIFYK